MFFGKANKGTITAVIAINTESEMIHFYTQDRQDVKNYRARPFEEDFFDKFNNILARYRERNPQLPLDNVALVLPDHVVIMDTVTIPVITRKAMQNSLNVAIDSIYKNSDDILFNTFQAVQTKQIATYNISGVRKDLIDRLVDICEKNQITVQCVTFAANTLVNGAIVMNSKLKNGSGLVLDIKETFTRFAFVTKGRTTGFYSLPFGFNMLYRTRLAAEDVLFDHAPGELLVLNAKEKAKAKRLTMFGGEVELSEEEMQETEQDADWDDGNTQADKPFTVNEDGIFSSDAEALPQKAARKLPKFMQRPIPITREEYIYENFRIYIKWALDLLSGNPLITSLGEPEAVYVNMPADFQFLFNMVNDEQESNGILFAPLTDGKEDEKTVRNLELFGGLYTNQYNRNNNF